MSERCECKHTKDDHSKYGCNALYYGSGCETHSCYCRGFRPAVSAEREELIAILKFRNEDIKVEVTEVKVDTNVDWTRVLPKVEDYIAAREKAAARRAWDERGRVEHAQWCVYGDPSLGRRCPADNPYGDAE